MLFFLHVLTENKIQRVNLCLMVLAQGKYLFAYNLQTYQNPFLVLSQKNKFCKNVNLSEKSVRSCKFVNGLIWGKITWNNPRLIDYLIKIWQTSDLQKKKNWKIKKKSSYFKHIEVWYIFFSSDKYTWACCQGYASLLLALEGKDQII